MYEVLETSASPTKPFVLLDQYAEPPNEEDPLYEKLQKVSVSGR